MHAFCARHRLRFVLSCLFAFVVAVGFLHLTPAASAATPAISAGEEHSLFLKADGTVRASGWNYYGQLGDGSNTDRRTPVQVMIGISAISAGSSHSLFLKTDATVWASGWNEYGQLGDGTKTNRSTPVQVMTGVAAISAGYDHSLFLKTDGTVWACGDNYHGQLGDGTTTRRITPVQVMTGVTAISAGNGYSLFLKTNGTLWACGKNYNGELGDGSNTTRKTPVQVMTGVAAISASRGLVGHSLFLKTDGTVLASGYNDNGQLGDGTTTTRTTPVQIMTGVAAISAGYSHSLFLRADGTAWACGYNGSGGLGDGSTTRRTTPVQIMTGVAAISANGYHSLFLKTDGTFWAAGGNTFGGLGDGTAINRKTPVAILLGTGTEPEPSKTAQTITFAALSDRAANAAPFALSATASSGLPVTFAVSGPATLGGDGKTVTLTGATGTVTVTATQAGNATYAAAASVARSFTVTATPGGGGSPPATSAATPEISAGGGHSLFLKNDGTVWTSGFNGAGQFGDGSITTRSTPVQVMTGVLVISAGLNHSLFLKADGTAWASGGNADGQLGDGSTTNRLTPVQVMTGVSAISAGSSHSLFLKADGTVWAAGSNNLGRLGDGTTINRATPVQVMTSVSAISAGDRHSLFLKTDGSVWASGHNGDGQFGNGTTTNSNTPVQVMTGVAAISAGGAHSLFLKTDGTVWATGANQSGQLGDSSTLISRSTPVQVMTGVAAISTGLNHTLFLKTDGTAWAAGNNRYAQLGDGTYSNRFTPVQVMTGVAAISAGPNHSLFLKTNGSVWASGLNDQGQLGVGDDISRATLTQVSIVLGASTEPGTLIPAATPTISAGSEHSLFLKSDGTVWASGNNDDGRLGDGTTSDRDAPVQVMTNVSAISAGGFHSLFLKTNGTVWSCGWNYVGTLGDGTTTDRDTPVQVMAGVAAISAHWNHSLFLKTDGTAWASGSNNFGRLGDGTTIERDTPVQVMTNVAAISAGYGHSLFLKTDGSVWASGLNDSGQLGDGSTTNRTTPVQVMTGVAAISAGWAHSLFLKTDGTVWASGWNNYGQLGDGSRTERSTPVLVMTGVSAISSNNDHTLFLKTDGTVWAAGRNYYGQLGDGTYTTRPTPVQVMTGVAAISAGGEHSLFLKTDGTVWAAGLNGSGQLGIDDDTYDMKTPALVFALSGTGTEPEPPKTAQTITFAALADRATNAAAFVLSATASSGLPVVFTVSGPATLSGSTVTLTGATGTVSVTATQAGNATYAAAESVTRTFAVTVAAKTAQTITFAALADRAANAAPFVLSATASSGLTVAFTVSGPATLSGSTVTLTGATGAVTVTATQAGDATYAAAAPVARSFTVTAAPSGGGSPVLPSIGTPAISAGGKHSLFLKSDGTAWASGGNEDGRLGDGSTTSRTSPVQVMTGVAAVSAGLYHSLFLKADGTAWASGDNTYGQLGDGSTTNRLTPVQVMTGVAAISADWGHSLFLKTDGTVWASGLNTNGQLGDGTFINRSIPVQVMTGVAAISAGSAHSLFLKTNGAVWAVGRNVVGQLGDGSKTTLPTPVQVMTGVSAISAGGGHSLFLKTNGSVWACGYNFYGQLGDGNSGYDANRTTPVQIMTGVAAISAGENHSLFLKTDGAVWAVGQNFDGALGYGDFPDQSTPVQVMTGVAAVSAGGEHSLFLKTDGSFWAAGRNIRGGLGVGDDAFRLTPAPVFSLQDTGTEPNPSETRILSASGNLAFGYRSVGQTATRTLTLANTGNAPLSITAINYPAGFSGNWSGGAIAAGASKTVTVTFAPTIAKAYGGNISIASNATGGDTLLAISGTANASGVSSPAATPAISSGGSHNLFLTSDGTVWAVGNNQYGQLGNGATTTAAFGGPPAQVMTGVSSISAGMYHSLFLKADGSVWASGHNFNGQLGDGRTGYDADRATPIQVMTGVAAVSAGDGYSLFLKTDGTVWASGNNANGQLGDRTYANRATPVQVMTGVAAISAGNNHSLFLKADGTVWACGWNEKGELGDGTTIKRNTPVQVMAGVAAISAGAKHSLFLKTDGTVWASGYNYSGELGDGTTTLRSTPVQIMSGVAAISAGGYYSLLLKTDGTVWGSGGNNYAQLGDGSTTDRATPVPIMTDVSAISAGNRQSLFLKINESAWACGHNGHGQLGDGSTISRTPPIRVALGTGTEPEPSETRILALAGDLFFDYITVGQSATRMLTITNTGTAPLSIININYPEGFSGNWSIGTIPAGSSQTVAVTFTPTTAEPYAGDITVVSNATNSGVTHNIFGIGSATNTPKTAQTITFAALPDRAANAAPFVLSATASSGRSVAFAVTGPAILGNFGTTLTLSGATGTVTVTATQPGNATYAAATPVARSFAVTAAPKTAQTITFAALPDRATNAAPFALSATASSGLPVAFAVTGPATLGGDGKTLTLTGAIGTVTVTATQLGNAAYAAAAPVERSFAVNTAPKTAQTITFAALPDRAVNATPFALSATASSGLPVSFSVSGPATLGGDGKTLTLTGATGTVTVTASQPGNATYAAAAPVARSFTVNTAPKTAQTITFATLPDRAANAAPFVLSATASSGLPVAFAVSGPATLGGDGKTLTLTGVTGTVTVTATQPGNATYSAAAPVERSFAVTAVPSGGGSPPAVWPGSKAGDSPLAAPGADPALRHYAKGLPPGLKIDALTGAITGVVSASAKPGVYPVQFWTQTGKAKSAAVTQEFTVRALPGWLAGGYDGLLRDAGDEPQARVEATVSAQGAVTGKLIHRDGKTYPLKGALVVADEGASAAATFHVAPTKTTSLWVALSLRENGEVRFAADAAEARLFTVPAASGAGHRRGAFSAKAPAPWQGRYNGYLDDSGSPGSPDGIGYVLATIDAKGAAKLTGKLADGIAYTAAIATGAAGEAVLFAQPYARSDSHLAGDFQLTRKNAASPWQVDTELGALVWEKGAGAKDKGYRAGFGPVAVAPVLRQWTPPAKGQTVAEVTPDLPRAADFGLLLRGAGLNNTELPSATSANPRGLPAVMGGVSTGNALGVAEANPAKLAAKVNPATGQITGGFVLSDEVATGGKIKTIARTVTMEAVLMQDEGGDGALAGGFFLVPPLDKTGETRSGLLALTPEPFREKQIAAPMKTGDVLKLTYAPNTDGYKTSTWTVTGLGVVKYQYTFSPKGSFSGAASWTQTDFGRNRSSYDGYDAKNHESSSVFLTWETPTSGTFTGDSGLSGTFTFKAK